MSTQLRLAFLGLLLSACGGSPSGPSPVSVPTPLAVRDTMNGITGARVPSTITQTGQTVTVQASGFLIREQPVSNPVWLWPQSESYVKATVYTVNDVPIDLIRWAPGSTIRLGLSPEINDAEARDRLEACAAELSRWHPTVVGEPANVRLELGDTGASLALTRWYLSGQTITGAQVIFRDRANVTRGPRRNTMLHELGHVLGLAGHSPLPSDVMHIGSSRTDAQAFGGDEAAALTMIYSWRKAGNRFPDTERVGLASRGRWVLEVRD